jgi:hypothetical protein
VRVLVACEYSGVVRDAFRARGHDAYSCDILPAEDNSPYHFQEDVLDVLSWCGPSFDLMIAHPPCTYLCNSGVHWLHQKFQYDETKTFDECANEEIRRLTRWKDLEDAREFFMALWESPIPKICIENPVPHKYASLPKYSQTIQPYQFGDDASKRTCLWLKGLPTLSIPGEDQWVQPRIVDGKKRWSNQTDSGQNRLGPSKNRALERSRTYQGIANAMAEQWGS